MSAPDYKANPSIDGTTVNNGNTGHIRAGKAPSPTDSEDLNRYVTDDQPRTERKAAPPPGVMVCLLPMIGDQPLTVRPSSLSGRTSMFRSSNWEGEIDQS
jgi:P pilus assembly chaperone PapD